MAKKRILSGMRPTGRLHLGHYVGALKNWVGFQDEYNCFFEVADWHALTSEYHNSASIAENTIEIMADYLCVGLDPKRSTIFVQSHVPFHSELHLILSMVTPVGWVERCPTYKDQVKELAAKDINTYGFLGYPVLQAADILMYRAHVVPVGEDQLPHLEMTREITRRFNNIFGEVFPEPQARLTEVPLLLGLDRRKMSKSYDNYIALAEAPDDVRKKIGGAITDPQRMRRSDPGRPDYCNIHAYYRVFVPDKAAQVAEQCKKAEIGCVECKKMLAEELIRWLAPIQAKRAEFTKDESTIRDIIAEGDKKARDAAAETMELVHKAIKF
ncbi:MAG: tryptophan--tRNA ligase [Planctomycetota bacterium]